MASPDESTWAQARENSHQLILQAALEDLENKAAKWEQELLTAKNTVETQRQQISSLQQEKSTLQSTVDTQSNELLKLKGALQKESSQVKALQETQTQTVERMDRLQAEGDTLREEIRYVVCMPWSVRHMNLGRLLFGSVPHSFSSAVCQSPT